ncbi:MAG: acyltransferase family protein [Anaerolineae bacterium]
MSSPNVLPQPTGATRETARLHYLDWLRVIATLGVFLFHASNVFNTTNFEIRNAEGSEVILIVDTLFYPWGMPLFFLLAGAGSWFALQRRSAGQFTRERTLRILVPFFTGTILLGPLQLYLSWSHRMQTGVFDGSFFEFVSERLSYTGPKIIGAIGYHMWFLGFLFAFSLLALPLFIWLKGETGRGLVSRLAKLCERRGAILLFILPPALVRLSLQPFFPQLQHWADFFTYGTFFVLGYVVFADERFTRAIRRDWRIILGVGIAATLAAMVIGMSLESFDIERSPSTFWEFLMWALIATCGWCWTAFVLVIGMRYLNRDSQALRYGQVTLLPFFVVHQPAILVIAYVVVQWEAALVVKLPVVVLGAFVMSLGITELVIKRVSVLQSAFGMKAAHRSVARLTTSSKAA